jgi:hypothetical protein
MKLTAAARRSRALQCRINYFGGGHRFAGAANRLFRPISKPNPPPPTLSTLIPRRGAKGLYVEDSGQPDRRLALAGK